MKYIARIAAAAYPLGWFIWATSKIGALPSCAPTAWDSAVSFGLVMAIGVTLGVAAAYEHLKEQPHA